MPVSHAVVPTQKASSYLQQLCKHWAHKFEVEFTHEHGTVPFNSDDVLTLDAADGVLNLTITTSTPAQQTRLEEVVANHLVRFAFREELTVAWQRR